jgi:hypothetical protein
VVVSQQTIIHFGILKKQQNLFLNIQRWKTNISSEKRILLKEIEHGDIIPLFAPNSADLEAEALRRGKSGCIVSVRIRGC